MSLVINTLDGRSEMLTDYKDIERKRRVNGEHSFSFLLLKTERNAHSFDLVQDETTVEYEGNEYRVKQIEERLVKSTPVKQVFAEHVFFDIIDVYQYGTLTTGAKQINIALTHALQGTGYTFSVVDPFGSVTFENFGDDNALSLFKTILERYQAEFIIVGKDVRIYKQIGQLTDFQFRYGVNVKTISKTIKTDNLSTYAKGFGKQNEDGTYVAQVEYTSPSAQVYGIRHAKPIRDERFTDEASLLDYVKSQIQETPEISITIDFVDLQKAGYPFSIPRLGDSVFTIFEPLSIDDTVRILEVVDFPDSSQSAQVTLANYNEDYTDVVFRHTKNELGKIYDESTGKVRYNVLDEAVRIATEALKSAQTELEFNQGIIARDPNNPNQFVLYNSAGLGITLNGGITFEEAITYLGINTNLLTAGQIKTNNIQIIGQDDLFYWDGNSLMAIDANDTDKWVRLNSSGLYAKKGTLTVERADGYPVIIGGALNYSVDVQGATPPFTAQNVAINGYFWVTNSVIPTDCQYYTFKHDARYLKVNVSLYAENANTGARMSIVKGSTVLAQRVTYNTDPTSSIAVNGEILTIDLGVPTGDIIGIYVRLNTGYIENNNRAFGRIVSMWKEG